MLTVESIMNLIVVGDYPVALEIVYEDGHSITLLPNQFSEYRNSELSNSIVKFLSSSDDKIVVEI